MSTPRLPAATGRRPATAPGVGFALLVALLTASSAMSETLYVNDEHVDDPPELDDMMGSCENAQYSSIQEAIDDAASGDTIMVCDCVDGGTDETYFEDFDEVAVMTIPEDIESLTIKSVFGPDNVILAGQGAMPLLKLEGENQVITLIGLTLQDGVPQAIELDQPPDDMLDWYVGGAIQVLAGEVDVQGCIIQNNRCDYSWENYGLGGAIYVHTNATLTVQDYQPTLFDLWDDPGPTFPTILTGNAAVRGGAIYAAPVATVTMILPEINANVALYLGGGVYASEGSIVDLIGGTLCGNYQAENAMMGIPELPILSKNIYGRVDRHPLAPGCVAVDCGVASECDENIDTLNVGPADPFQTIQAAINAAGPGDTIRVAAGTYLETINLEGKAVTIEARDPSHGATVIEAPSDDNWDSDGDGDVDDDDNWPDWKWSAPTVTMTSGERDTTILRGFTIAGGAGAEVFIDALNGFPYAGPYAGIMNDVGGGILCGGSFPRIEDCIIRDNMAGDGGGIFAGAGAEPTILNTIACSNVPLNYFGPVIDEGGSCQAPTCEDDNGNGTPDTCEVNDPPVILPMDPNLDAAALQSALDDAITAAHHGDIIDFPAGTYPVSINPRGKALIFRGAGPSETVLDGEDATTLIVCNRGEMGTTLFEDMTLTSGHGARGGAARLTASSPTFSNITFLDNMATDSGGAVFMSSGAKPIMDNCRFDNNTANWGGGGVYAAERSAPLLVDCAFTGNQTGQIGGGVAVVNRAGSTPIGIPFPYPFGVEGSNPAFINCSFAANSAARYGGGVWSGYSCEPWFDNCTFQNNVGEWSGGGVYIQSMNEYSDASDMISFGPHPGYPDDMIGYPVFFDLDDDGVGGSAFACNETSAVWGDASAWWDPYLELEPFSDDAECLYCNPDVNRDMRVDFHDLIRVIDTWGNCDGVDGDPPPPPGPVLCDEDVNGDYVVEVLDLLEVLVHYGKECPIDG
ncbi:MAG: right-handed parallel beta-helix repeat-containing protein [Phycisphaerales bacterium]|jgi:hypothetical protein|nr:right-handed parallel beta-helix repeat-containing protein [Phycisphaerales bacterium]